MDFLHQPEIWADHPTLAPGVLAVHGIHPGLPTRPAADDFSARARARITHRGEGELPEVQAWRRAFSRMGLKPTQYRCAAESLLRRLRQDGALPTLHPLVDLCNAASAAFAIPVAVFDLSRIEGDLRVRHASGQERYHAFSGEVEAPAPGEVVFADSCGQAHARRWTHRQSAWSAIRPETRSVLIVAEALHDGAAADVRALVGELATVLARVAQPTTPAVLSATSPRFTGPV